MKDDFWVTLLWKIVPLALNFFIRFVHFQLYTYDPIAVPTIATATNGDMREE